MPPFGQPITPFELYVDVSITRNERIAFNAGSLTDSLILPVPEYLRVAGPAAEGTYITFLGAPASVLPSAQAFVKRYHERFPNDELKAYDHWGYEAMSILLDLIHDAGPDREKILAALPKIKHEGVLGVTRFDDKGDTLNKTITIFEVKNGKFVPLQ